MTAETAGIARISVAKGRAGAIGDLVFRALTFLFALLVLLILGGVIVSLVAGAWPALRTFGFFSFVTTQVWNPVTEQFGALAAIYGTLVTSAIAMLIGIPVAFGVAVFITEISPIWLKRPLATMIELLAAIPSIIYGIWGLFVFAPFVQQYIQPAIINTFRADSRHRRAVRRAATRHRHSDRRFHPGDHGIAVHFVDHARRVRDRAADAEGKRLWARRHA